MNRTILASVLVAVLGALCIAQAAPASVTVGYYTDGNAADTGPVAPINANDYTPLQITDISTFDFSTVDVVMIDNYNISGISAALLAREADLAAYANAGGAVVIHDRYVGDNSLIPGGSAISLTYATTDDLNVVTTANAVINGPFGTITDTTLDGGGFSAHGYATASSLPAGATVFLSNGSDASHAAAFSFPLGSGIVYYGAIPLDYYLDSPLVTPTALGAVYASNVLNYAATAVPEPGGSLALLAMGGLALLVRFRRRPIP